MWSNPLPISRVVIPFLLCAMVGIAQSQTTAPSAQALFRAMPVEVTGIDHVNPQLWTKRIDSAVKFFNQMVPGCGVALGDIDADGRTDIVLSGFRGLSIYRNLGDWKFENVTNRIGYSQDSLQYCTGPNVADVDGDGDLDIFVTRWQHRCRLLINNGNWTFKESAAEYGLDHIGESVNSVFFDYDGDGWLDCYVLTYSNAEAHKLHLDQKLKEIQSDAADTTTNATKPRATYGLEYKEVEGVLRLFDENNMRQGKTGSMRHEGTTDVLYRNQSGKKFTNANSEAWINDNGMGLSATVSDINLDGRPDIYVANDFNMADYIYINVGDGMFSNKKTSFLDKTSHFSMGSDVADINGDCLPDIITTDMLGVNHMRRILNSMNTGDVSKYNPMYDSSQFIRNMLHLNRGYGKFSEIGYLTNVAASDWSWACLIQDFDLDGASDIYIANGYLSDFVNQDFVYNINLLRDTAAAQDPLREPNMVFRQSGHLKFDEVAKQWGLFEVTPTFGTAYGDLDGDGDPDLITANIDTLSGVYRNMAAEQKLNSFVAVKLSSKISPNTHALGAKVYVMCDGKRYYKENYHVRGFQSVMDEWLMFGLGSATNVDTLLVEWPSGRVTTIFNPAINSRVEVVETLENASKPADHTSIGLQQCYNPLVEDLTDSLGLGYLHIEDDFDDFNNYRLTPLRHSWGGPALAVGDVNGDSQEDVVFGNSRNRKPAFYLQNNGTFRVDSACASAFDPQQEIQAMLLIDVDNDKDLDVLVAGGGVEHKSIDNMECLLLYRNDGKGRFTRDTTVARGIHTNSTTLNAADVDNDGDLDVFLGGGIVTNRYPLASSSCLMLNDGKGHFTDATDSKAPGLRNIGNVRSALWTDYDNDGKIDLIVVGEWMPITLFHNEGGAFVNRTKECGLSDTQGWWYGLQGADIDNDGDVDYIVGNVGLNTRYHPKPNKPIELWSYDYDDNGSIDPLLVYWPDSTRRLMRDRYAVFAQMPTMQRTFNSFMSFATASLKDVIGHENKDSVDYRFANTMESCVLINQGKGVFNRIPLPIEAQFSPVMGIQAVDLNNDDYLDLVLSGNHYGAEADVVRYDAGKGQILLGQGNGRFTAHEPGETDLMVPRDMRGLAVATLGKGEQGKPILVFAANHGLSMAYGILSPLRILSETKTVAQKLGRSSTPLQRKQEKYLGSGYRTQSSPHIFVPRGKIDAKKGQR